MPESSPARIIQAVRLTDIRLLEAEVFRKIETTKGLGAVEVEISHAATAAWEPEAPRLVVTFRACVDIRPKGAAPESVAVRVSPAFELYYNLPEGFEATQDEFDAIASLSGTFNAWPYLREFVQSTTTRMGLPPFVVPVLRLPRRPAKPAARKPASR